ncbi:hypothetical protein M501DRAFT_1059993 [Patellaria atrata CBS 101060]|uniref:Carboxymuconolactone decarboxylase-like domain-containing protein n=1 Tax=Patellaria atrata CBS 101060 TaxID=1346257 RepID=A0A9P4VKP9_9PEZI|nr:hypothetical protein M501DRAFT_1059993 [Patellaria atrata CBS 101060]
MSTVANPKNPPVFVGIAAPPPAGKQAIACLDPNNCPATHEACGKVLNFFPFRRNIFELLARSSGSFPHLMRTLGSIFNGAERTIPLLDWQLIVLRVAGSLDAAYEFDVNEPVARVYEMGDDKIQALKDGLNTEDILKMGIWSERQQCIITLVDESLATYTNKESTIEWAKKLMTEDEVVECFIVLGLYAMIARITRGLRVQIDPEIPGLDGFIRKGVTKNARDP